MRTFGTLVLAIGAFVAAAAVPTVSAVMITDTAITTVNPPMLVINGSDLAGGTPVVTLGQFAPLTVVTQTATQVTALLPGNVTLQGTYLVTLQLNGKGGAPNALGYDEAWVAVGSAGAAGPPGPPGTTGQEVIFLADTSGTDIWFTHTKDIFTRTFDSAGREVFVINYQASLRSMQKSPCGFVLYVRVDNQIIGAAIQSAVSSVTPGVPNVVEGWATVSGTAAFESRTVGTHYIRLEVLGCSTAMYRWPAMTITRINK